MNDLFKALDDPTRRRILDILRVEDRTAGDIAEHFHMTKPSISHHLDILRRAGLVVSRKEGQFVHYSLSASVLEETIAWLVELRQTQTTTCIDSPKLSGITAYKPSSS